MNCTVALSQYATAEKAIVSHDDITSLAFIQSRCSDATFTAFYIVFTNCPTLPQYPTVDPGIGDSVGGMMGFCGSHGINWNPPEEPKGMAATTMALLIVALIALPSVGGIFCFLRRKRAVQLAEKKAIAVLHEQVSHDIELGNVDGTQPSASEGVSDVYVKREAHAMAEAMVRAEEAKKAAAFEAAMAKRAKKGVSYW
ncbi:UNVERIFIED_CONTAM: hypothetical protein HDU68_005171 [Siphonaria sp. JEL0065]|nr:hypothetical protein HDU68_005171 [Siphonaria sp. JEL0065]